MGFTSAPGGVPVYEQATEPLLSDERTAIWADTSESPNPVWLIFARSDGLQCRVEMTPRTWETYFTEDFESPDWLGVWTGTASDFTEDFEDPVWAGAWTGTFSDFVEDFQSWPVGPV